MSNGYDNLIPASKGEVRNPNGRPKGVPNRKTVLNYFLFEADLEGLGLNNPNNKPSWWDKAKPRNIYEAMTIAMAVKAMSGDVGSYNAINRALGEYQIQEKDLNVVHIFKPEKLAIDEFNAEGERLRKHTRDMVEGEIVNEPMEGTARASDDSFTSAG